jgi:hypothetical protein
MPPSEGAPALAGNDEALAILRRLDTSRGEFVTYKSLITILLSVLGAFGVLGGYFINTQVSSVKERVDIAIERKFVEVDGRLANLENRLTASIEDGVDKIQTAVREAGGPPPNASVVAWKDAPSEIPSELVDVEKLVSPVGIYTLSPGVWDASAEDQTENALALKRLLFDGALQPVFPQ